MGGRRGEFDSGTGTSDRVAVGRYVEAVGRIVAGRPGEPLRVVDLGCGDFRVGRQIAPLVGHYTGVDVVQALVARNRAAFSSATVTFEALDIITDRLPEADICLVRQVLQHLSNSQITAILRKLSAYPLVVITEHQPADGSLDVANIDKAQGADTRLHRNSGVYLDRAPFDVPAAQLQLILEVPAPGSTAADPAGWLRTFLYTPVTPWPPR